jgi:hypothetical protein
MYDMLTSNFTWFAGTEFVDSGLFINNVKGITGGELTVHSQGVSNANLWVDGSGSIWSDSQRKSPAGAMWICAHVNLSIVLRTGTALVSTPER